MISAALQCTMIDSGVLPSLDTRRFGAAGYARLNSAVRKLLGDDALLLIREAIEGFSQAEVAVELGLTEAAAHKRHQRAMRRLHDAIEEIP